MGKINMTSPIMLVINEMMAHAANDIGFPPSDGNVDQLLNDLENDFGIDLNPDGPITTQLMDTIVFAIREWKVATKNNHA